MALGSIKPLSWYKKVFFLGTDVLVELGIYVPVGDHAGHVTGASDGAVTRQDLGIKD